MAGQRHSGEGCKNIEPLESCTLEITLFTFLHLQTVEGFAWLTAILSSLFPTLFRKGQEGGKMPYPSRQSLRKTAAAGKVTLGSHQEELMHQEAAESSEPSPSSLGTQLRLPLSQELGQSSKAPARTEVFQGHPPPAQQRLRRQPQLPSFHTWEGRTGRWCSKGH